MLSPDNADSRVGVTVWGEAGARHAADSLHDGSGGGRIRGAISRNPLLIAYLAAGFLLEAAASFLGDRAFHGELAGLHTVAKWLGWAAFLVVGVGLVHVADHRTRTIEAHTRAIQAHTRAMKAACEAARIDYPGEDDREHLGV